MLRYDGAYRTQKIADGYRIEMVGFTPARWESFGVTPKHFEFSVLAKEYYQYSAQATGFTEGIRFAQELLDATLIQGR